MITVILISLIIIYFLSASEKIKTILYRIVEAEKQIEEVLQKKLDLIIRANGIIKNNIDLNIDMFGEIENIKLNKVNNIKLDRKLETYYKTILQIYNDYPQLQENRGLKDIIKEIKAHDEKIEAGKKFYNEHTTNLRKLNINIFRKIVFKLMRVKNYRLYKQ